MSVLKYYNNLTNAWEVAAEVTQNYNATKSFYGL